MNHRRRRFSRISAIVIFAMGCLLLGTTLIAGPSMLLAAQGVEMDLMFVIDNSGSMHKNDPGFLTPRTVRTFVNQLPDETRVGMVLFDQSARLLQSLSPLSDSQAKQRLIASLNQVDYKGRYTNSAAGIERAMYELKSAGRSQAKKCIIFLTDGIVDTGRPQKDLELTQWLKSDLASECRDLGIRIFGIAFTENADFVLIQALAARTDGAYFRAYAAEDIAGVLDQIQEQLAPPPEEVPAKSPVVAPQPEPQAPPQATESAINTSSESAPPPVPATSGSRSFLKFYLPLILIIFLLIGVLLFLMARGARPMPPRSLCRNGSCVNWMKPAGNSSRFMILTKRASPSAGTLRTTFKSRSLRCPICMRPSNSKKVLFIWMTSAAPTARA